MGLYSRAAAVGPLVELDKAQHTGQTHQHGTLVQGMDILMGFGYMVFHRDTSI